jgi:hypothetical protein
MPMLPLHVGWCLPLPIPSSKIAIPTQKLTNYLTLKLTTHVLPYPKTQPKTHNPHATLTKNSTKNSLPTCYPSPKHTCETMLSPSKVVGWECGAYAYTNKDATRYGCLACQARCPVCYAIVAGAIAAATARTTRVNCRKQAHVAALPTAGPVVAGEVATSTNWAVTGEAPNATYGPPAVAGSAAMHHGRAPQLGGNCASVVACLVNTMVDIIGTSAKDRGHNCPFHACCGMQLQVGSKICFHREQLIYCKGQEEDVFAVHVVWDSTMTCKVGFLPQHLAARANAYDGLQVCIVNIYSNRCTNVLKREKFWQN